MSSHSYTDKCPKCKNEMDCYFETRDPEQNRKDCWHCGHTEYMNWCQYQKDKQQLINERVEQEICYGDWQKYVESCEMVGVEPKTFEKWTEHEILIGEI